MSGLTEPMTMLDVLRWARDLISDPDRWTQRQAACDRDGRVVIPESPEACRWCAVGACAACPESGERYWEAAVWALHDAAKLKGAVSIAAFNDTHTHAEVLALYDEVIAA